MPSETPKLHLRLKIAVALATVCIMMVGAVGVTLYMASESLEAALIDHIVAEELDSLIQRDAAAPVPSGPHIQYYVVRTSSDYQSIPPRLHGLGAGQHSVGADTDELRVGVRDIGGVRYIVAYDAGPHELREQQFRYLILFALGTGAAVTIGMAYWIAGVLTRQITELAGEVSALAADAPHAPLARPDHYPEVAALAHAFDSYHARIVNMVRREQEFTANASHELRTPLTAVRTSCELLATESQLSEKGRSRLQMIDAAAEQMTERIEALLFLARQLPPAVPEDVMLHECVTQAAAVCRDEIARKSLAFEVSIDADAQVRLDRKALQIVVGNLIKNAVRYTECGFVRVSFDGHQLTVADSGAGIAAQHLPRVFERFFRGNGESEGLGIGLALVRRICDELGWKIEVVSKPGAGSAFSVSCPEWREASCSYWIPSSTERTNS